MRRGPFFRPYAFALLLFASVITYFSCRKSEPPKPSPPAAEKKPFFEAPKTRDMLIDNIVNALNRLNETTPFAAEMVKNAGYPQWSYAMTNANNSSKEQDTGEVINIPLVKPEEKKTSAILSVKIANGDTTCDLIYPQYYIRYGFQDSGSREAVFARELFYLFAEFDHTLFGNYQYFINDGRIFDLEQTDTLLVNIEYGSPQSQRQQPGQKVEDDCRTVRSCLYVGSSSAMRVTSLPAPKCVVTTICSTPLPIQPFGGGGIIIGDRPVGVGGNGSTTGTGTTSTTPPTTGAGGVPITTLTGTPCMRVGSGNLKLPTGSDPCGTAGPWTPTPTYTLNSRERSIWDEIYKEEAEADAVFNKNCQGTNRTGNMQWPGTMEHWMIMIDYISQNPVYGEVEYQIPGGSLSGKKGYADIVDRFNREIFEIKPDKESNINDGTKEVAQYVLAAQANCPAIPGDGGLLVPWSAGSTYATRELPDPRNPLLNIKAQQVKPGVITYSSVSRITEPIPIIIPSSALDKVKNLLKKLRQNLHGYEVVITQFLNENPDLKAYLKTAAFTAAVAIIVGTIVEDFLTAGVGAGDDWASFLLAWRIVNFASRL